MAKQIVSCSIQRSKERENTFASRRSEISKSQKLYKEKAASYVLVCLINRQINQLMQKVIINKIQQNQPEVEKRPGDLKGVLALIRSKQHQQLDHVPEASASKKTKPSSCYAVTANYDTKELPDDKQIKSINKRNFRRDFMKNILMFFLEKKSEPCIKDFLDYLYEFYKLERTHIQAFFQGSIYTSLSDLEKMYFGQNFFYQHFIAEIKLSENKMLRSFIKYFMSNHLIQFICQNKIKGRPKLKTLYIKYSYKILDFIESGQQQSLINI